MKNKNLKNIFKIIIIFVVGIIILLECTPILMKKHVAKELKKKYQEEFKIASNPKILSNFPVLFLGDYYTVNAYSKEYPDMLFEVSVDIPSGDISDQYVAKRVSAKISDKISENIKTLANDYYVYTEAMFGYSLVSDSTISLEEYFQKEPDNKFTIYLFLDENGASAQNIVLSLLNIMKGMPGFDGSVSLYLADSELLTKIKEYVTSHDDTYWEFDEMVDKAYIGSVQFENAHFSLTEYKLKEMAGDRLN